MPEKTQQFAQNIARSLIGEEAAHPAQPLIQMQGIRKSYYIGQPNGLEIQPCSVMSPPKSIWLCPIRRMCV